ncbi:MAG: excinuclease ABC subunit UvrB [Nanoarchaeota archaeon]|nr:excinuclease ABC subunit UvrB [Nanoarchaeota archaeon]
MKFKLQSSYKPTPPQLNSISKITQEFEKNPNNCKQTLLGITGSGKSFIMANVIEKLQKKTLILAHNKTLAAQLYQEFVKWFPENRVEYFISYYDYYQPESYIPTSDTYIEKEATVNEQIEKMRLKTMASLLSRDDVIVVASISCIYGAGNPEDFKELSQKIKVGEEIHRGQLLLKIVEMLYERVSGGTIESGQFRVRGETIEVYPAYDNTIVRIEMFGDEIERIAILDSVSLEVIQELDEITLYPAKQFAVTEEKIKSALNKIRDELDEWLPQLSLLEAERLKRRTKYDLEMIEEVGYCSGIENYSRHFEQRAIGTPPHVLLDYFGDDFLLIIDESHQTIPQSHGMYNGDYARKKNLVEYGFRLPCAFDNRPLKFNEFEKYFKNCLFVSATPSEYELTKSTQLIEQIIRPTGLLDPIITVKPCEGQVKECISQIKTEVEKFKDSRHMGGRVLVTTLTKRMAQDLAEYIAKEKIKVRYLHSDIDSLERIEIIRQLRAGEFDVLVGINLLREGLDIPEVSLVCILDADKEGFLRNEKSLIQTIGRAARNVEGKVTLFADRMNKSLTAAIEKTKFRRKQQEKYNIEHGITPTQIIKVVDEKEEDKRGKTPSVKSQVKAMTNYDIEQKIIECEGLMQKASEELDFERAIKYRDLIDEYRKELK